jgi:hypothetical protein
MLYPMDLKGGMHVGFVSHVVLMHEMLLLEHGAGQHLLLLVVVMMLV